MSGLKIVRRTTRTLFKTVFWLLLFITVGVGTYKLTLYYYKSTGQYASAAADDSKAIVKATTDAIAVNAIFAVDGDDGRIKHLVIEIFNSGKGKIDFVTLPTDSLYGMSKELYSTLSKENPNVPQILAWKDVPQYFGQATAYQYGTLLLEESLGIPISFYTLMSESTFQEYFEEISGNSLDEQLVTKGYTLKQTVCETIKTSTSALQLEKELASYYRKVQSNLSLSRRSTYLSSYMTADYDNIGIHTLQIDADTNQIMDKEWVIDLIKE